MTNSVDPDQTESALFAKACVSENVGSLQPKYITRYQLVVHYFNRQI